MNTPYDDIIDLPRHVSPTRPPMSRENRAAQFSPFQALTGYGDAVKETARRTDRRVELDEDALSVLDRKLSILTDHIAEHPEVAITCFREDTRKAGGSYVTVTGTLKKIDGYERAIVLLSGERIAIEDTLDIECELFKSYL